ncbi:MAG: hypothetical protein ACK5H4_15670 [Lacrimispora sphenoides]
MENSLTIQTVLKQRNSYNLAIPFVESVQVNPYFKLSVSLLQVDTTEQAAQIFKVGSKSLGNNRWEDLFSLTKPFLQRLATEAGIQFAPGAGDVVKMDENTWKASAFGALRLPDGSVRTSNNFKVIDLLTEERKYRLSYEEKAAHGIADYKAAKAASERYSGEWIDTGQKNDKGYPIKIFVITEEDMGKYIEQSLLDAMAQLRANAPQKAATGAILRVIRDLTGVKGTYTLEELKKPFAVARMSFSPDYNDPAVKQMMLQQCMQSVGNLFGNVQPVVQTISIPQVADEEDEVDMPVDVEEAESPRAELALHPQNRQSIHTELPQGAGREMEEDRTLDFRCDKCNDVIPQKVWDYSVEHYGRPLCYKCQKIVRNERR